MSERLSVTDEILRDIKRAYTRGFQDGAAEQQQLDEIHYRAKLNDVATNLARSGDYAYRIPSVAAYSKSIDKYMREIAPPSDAGKDGG